MVVFGEHDYPRFFGLRSHKSAQHRAASHGPDAIARGSAYLSAVAESTYACHYALAKPGASVEPVIVLELVDLDAFSFVSGRRP